MSSPMSPSSAPEPVAQMAPAGSGGGNTISPPPLKKQRVSGASRWLFTWNNYPEDWLAQMAPGLDGSEWIVGYEVGAEGTPHLQGYVEFPIKVRPIKYKGFSEKIHWGDKDGKPCKGNRAHNVNYCSKDGNVEYASTLKPPRQLVFPEMNLPWEIEILDIIKDHADDRSIYWYWSEEGCLGKTTFCKYMVIKHKACLLAGKGADVRNGALTYKKDLGKYPEIICFPVPRSFNSDYLSYEAIENVKDACFYSGKYEGGAVADLCPHLFVFANFPPDRSRMSKDRWVIKCIDPKKDEDGNPKEDVDAFEPIPGI